MRECDENFLLFVQVERMLDRSELEALLDVPEIDCIHIGPGDMTLASTTGCPEVVVSKETKEYMGLASNLAEKHGKSFCWSGNEAVGNPMGNVFCSRFGILMSSVRDYIDASVREKK
jgi:2-keto-3-deoxy-L-rhamnonate aldolase RhmA